MLTWLRVVAAGTIVLLFMGCTARHYDPSPGDDRVLHATTFDSPLSVERSMRVLYARLEECTGIEYHVQPRFVRSEGRAWVMVVSGLGFDRFSVIGNRFELRFDVSELADGSRVSISNGEPRLAPLVEASRDWLVDGSRACRREQS